MVPDEFIRREKAADLIVLKVKKLIRVANYER